MVETFLKLFWQFPQGHLAIYLKSLDKWVNDLRIIDLGVNSGKTELHLVYKAGNKATQSNYTVEHITAVDNLTDIRLILSNNKPQKPEKVELLEFIYNSDSLNCSPLDLDQI